MKINIPIPPAIARLPRDGRGYPMPFFAARIEGQLTAAVADIRKAKACAKHRLCWICGERINGIVAFIGGPNCCNTGRFSDGPMHPVCAEFAMKVCPYLAYSKVDRLDKHALAGNQVNPAGFIQTKPEKHGLYLTKGFVSQPDGTGSGALIFKVVDCLSLTFWVDGAIVETLK